MKNEFEGKNLVENVLDRTFFSDFSKYKIVSSQYPEYHYVQAKVTPPKSYDYFTGKIPPSAKIEGIRTIIQFRKYEATMSISEQMLNSRYVRGIRDVLFSQVSQQIDFEFYKEINEIGLTKYINSFQRWDRIKSKVYSWFNKNYKKRNRFYNGEDLKRFIIMHANESMFNDAGRNGRLTVIMSPRLCMQLAGDLNQMMLHKDEDPYSRSKFISKFGTLGGVDFYMNHFLKESDGDADHVIFYYQPDEVSENTGQIEFFINSHSEQTRVDVYETPSELGYTFQIRLALAAQMHKTNEEKLSKYIQIKKIYIKPKSKFRKFWENIF